MSKNEDSARLKRLFAERAGMSQEEFGQRYGIGTQAMVSQYLTGYQQLNIEAAAKFAKGLRCTIADISPDLARRLKVEIFPVLGKVTVRAIAALLISMPPMLPSKAEAALNISITKIHMVFVWLRMQLNRLVRKSRPA